MNHTQLLILLLLVVSNFFPLKSESSILRCFGNNQKTQIVNNELEIGLENELLYIGFDNKSGKLISLINKITKDNYIKKTGDGNIFRLYINTKTMPDLVAGAHKYDYGGTVIEPSSLKLENYRFSDNGYSKSITLNYNSKKIPVNIILEIVLPDSSNYFDSHLEVENLGVSPFSIYTAFPYLAGICLGDNPGANLAVNIWDRGYPGIDAWGKPSGGVYSRDVSMQWQCVYEPSLKQGLAFIAMDSLFLNKILTCFPEGGMTSFYFDKKIIESGAKQKWPSSRIIVFNGNWRIAALEYKKWFSANIKTQEIPKWYKKEVAKRSSTWFPTKEDITKNKKSGNKKLFTSFEQIHDLFRGTYNDCMEIAMWNEDVNLWPETYGPWMSSGFIDFRSDLGGVAAFKKGIETCHRYGRRVAMYVAGYGARKTSPMYEGNWQTSAIMKNEKGDYSMDYCSDKEIFGAFNCPGFKPWQDHIIHVCKMLAEAGIDEIRLDGIGFPFRPCFNPVHNHKSPYDCNQWMREFLRRIREATDLINPELAITSEFFMDYFHESTNGALVMDCSGSEIDAMKIAMPTYLPLSYHASASEAAITGAIMSKTESNRLNWAWVNVGTEKPDDYNEKFVRDLLWYELYPTFSAALTYGEITDWDPVAVNDPKWMGHLWKYTDYWLLTGGHIDATPLKDTKVNVKLPQLPSGIEKAFEFNIETREMSEVEIKRSNNEISISLKSAVSAVLFPLPSCPPLPIIKQNKIVVSKDLGIEVNISLFAPWRDGVKSNALSTIRLTAPGFKVTDKISDNSITYLIHIPNETPVNDFFYTVTGECLKAKRWFEVKDGSEISISGTKSLTVFPNPASVSFALKLNNAVEGSAVIRIFNSSGIKVMELQAENNDGELLKEIAVNNLKAGIYIAQVLLNQKDLFATKIVVIK